MQLTHHFSLSPQVVAILKLDYLISINTSIFHVYIVFKKQKILLFMCFMILYKWHQSVLLHLAFCDQQLHF